MALDTSALKKKSTLDFSPLGKPFSFGIDFGIKTTTPQITEKGTLTMLREAELKMIAGGLPRLFSEQEAPKDIIVALTERLRETKKDITEFDVRKDPEKVAETVFNTMPIGMANKARNAAKLAKEAYEAQQLIKRAGQLKKKLPAPEKYHIYDFGDKKFVETQARKTDTIKGVDVFVHRPLGGKTGWIVSEKTTGTGITTVPARTILEAISHANELLAKRTTKEIQDAIKSRKEIVGELPAPKVTKEAFIPPEDLVKKTIKYEGGYKTILEQKSTGKEIVNVSSSPQAAKQWLKEGYGDKPVTTKLDTTVLKPTEPLAKEAVPESVKLKQTYLSKLNEERGIKVSKQDKEFLGKSTFTINAHGYPTAKIKGEMVYLHDLVMGTKKAKGFVVDHINKNKLDNRIENLRITTQRLNQYNRRVLPQNTSGIIGVRFNEQIKKWTAVITVNKKSKHLGSFSTVDEAVKARQKAETKYVQPLIDQAVKGVEKPIAKSVGIAPKEAQPPRKPVEKKPVAKDVIVPEVSLKEKVTQQAKLSKVFVKEGRFLVDEVGNQVFPRPTKTSPTPAPSPAFEANFAKELTKRIDKEIKLVGQALESVGKRHGQTEIIIANLKKKGLSQKTIDNIVLENGDRLVDTVKVKREPNGVLSATIRKDTLEEIETNFTKLNQDKWIPVKTAIQKSKEAGRNAKSVALDYYELPQIFFDRTKLRKWFYDPIRDAERNAQDMKTAIFKQFEEAGLLKKGGWFTADRFNLTKKEAERVGEYYLTRQKKGGNISLEDLTTQEKKFVDTFDNVIKESEDRFYKVAELNGKSPGKVENYAPIMTSKDYKLAREIGDMEFIFRKHPAFFSLKQRVEKVPFDMYELDYRRIASKWIDQVANFNNLGEVGTQVKYLSNSDEFKELVGDRIYKTTNKWLQNKFNPQVLTELEKGARFLRQKSAIAALGLNYASVVKQVLTQVPLTIIEKAPPKLRSKFAKDFGIKVSDLASIKERKGNVAIMDMQEGLNKIFVGQLTKADIMQAQLSLNRLLDKNYNKFLKEGKEITQEVQAQIIKQSQDLLDMWYGGMTQAQLPLAFRSEMGKLLNMFIYPLTSQLNGFIYSVAKAKGINKVEKFAEVAVSALVIAYMEQVITNLSPKWSDTKEMVKDTLASLAGNIPLLSQVVFAFRTDQPLSPSPIVSSISRAVSQTSKSFDDQADAGDVAFAWTEMFGLPKSIRRAVDGAIIVQEGGLRDKNGKLLAPVTGSWEQVRAFVRGKYGTIATQDWIRNIGVKTEEREWYVPEVEFLQNGDYNRKAELFKAFDMETKLELYAELSEGQQKKLDKAITEPPKSSLEDIFGSKKTLESIFK